MKTKFILLITAVVALLASCVKEYDRPVPGTPPNIQTTHKYGSLTDFYSAYGVHAATFTLDASMGTNFTTVKGTLVTIPANAFVTLSGAVVTGQVSIEFKDLYQKSDMLFSDKPTTLASGGPLKSAGEFWIKATSGGAAVKLGPGYSITVTQPLGGLPQDPMMQAFVAPVDTQLKWAPAQNGWVNDSAFGNYVFSLYQFSSPEDSGTWCNSDNSMFFASYPQTTLTMSDVSSLQPEYADVFLVFADINCMVHVYRDSYTNSFPYLYAPVGLNCMVVAFAVKDSALYSSFTPITISANQTVDYNLAPTTDNARSFEISVTSVML